MIRLQDITPGIFYTKSRDFQYIGRLYDLVLNATKTDIDTIAYINDPTTCDSTLLNLLASSLGFKAKRSYNIVQLRAVCSVLNRIMHSKGSIKALTTACDAILAAEGITETADYTLDAGQLTIFLPYTLSELALIEDLFDYVLPAGISCTIVRELKITKEAFTFVGIDHEVTIYVDSINNVQDSNLGVLAETLVDPSTITSVTDANNMAAMIAQHPADAGFMGNISIIRFPWIENTDNTTSSTSETSSTDTTISATEENTK